MKQRYVIALFFFWLIMGFVSFKYAGVDVNPWAICGMASLFVAGMFLGEVK